MAKKDGYTVHEGPRADRQGTGWREDAAKLEAMAQIRRENPMQTLPNRLTTIDRAHAARAKSDEGLIDKAEYEAGGGEVKIEE